MTYYNSCYPQLRPQKSNSVVSRGNEIYFCGINGNQSLSSPNTITSKNQVNQSDASASIRCKEGITAHKKQTNQHSRLKYYKLRNKRLWIIYVILDTYSISD